jgi:hypothetical protein
VRKIIFPICVIVICVIIGTFLLRQAHHADKQTNDGKSEAFGPEVAYKFTIEEAKRIDVIYAEVWNKFEQQYSDEISSMTAAERNLFLSDKVGKEVAAKLNISHHKVHAALAFLQNSGDSSK